MSNNQDFYKVSPEEFQKIYKRNLPENFVAYRARDGEAECKIPEDIIAEMQGFAERNIILDLNDATLSSQICTVIACLSQIDNLIVLAQSFQAEKLSRFIDKANVRVLTSIDHLFDD